MMRPHGNRIPGSPRQSRVKIDPAAYAREVDRIRQARIDDAEGFGAEVRRLRLEMALDRLEQQRILITTELSRIRRKVSVPQAKTVAAKALNVL